VTIDREKAKILLDEFFEVFDTINSNYDKLNEILGVDVDSPFFDPISLLVDMYTKRLQDMFEDDFDSISWHIWENDCGRKEYEAKCGAWKAERKIKNTDDLLDLILEVPTN